MKKSDRFSGLELTKKDRAELRRMQSAGLMTARTWRRVRVLLLLDEGWSATKTAKAVGGYVREASRVGKRYVEGGLGLALTDNPRPGSKPLLDSTQEAAVVAMVCGPAPAGRARWTTLLIAKEAVHRGIAGKVGRETVRLLLAHHDLKPWREKNVVRSGDHGRVRRADGRRVALVRATVQPERARRRN